MTAHSGMPLVEGLIVLALVLVVPLGLRLGRTPRNALGVLALVVPCAVTSFFVADPLVSGLLTAPYLAFTLWLAAAALPRLLGRGFCAEALLDIGQLQLVVAAAWLLASRGGLHTGFDATITALTAVHFHYAGFAAATIAGCVLRGVKAPVAGGIVALGPALVGLGIAFSPAIEVLSAVVLALGMLGLARAMVRLHPVLALPALPLLGTMALAIGYASNAFAPGLVPWLNIPVMVQLHGLANALGFAALGLVLLQFLAPAEVRAPADLPPLPALEPIEGDPPRGLYPSLVPFGLDDVPDEVKAYQLDSTSVTLLVRPRWRFPLLGALVHRVNRRIGNLALPYEDRVHRVQNVLSPMATPGWVFSVRSTDYGPMFRLAYGTHGRHMRVVAPLPFGALDVFLLGSGSDAHVLKTDALYAVLGPVRVRLPLEERLDGHVAHGHFMAQQRFVLFGVEILRMDYAIAPDPDEALLA